MLPDQLSDLDREPYCQQHSPVGSDFYEYHGRWVCGRCERDSDRLDRAGL